MRNSETGTFFERALALVNLPLLLGALLFEFSHAITSNIIFFPNDATRAISRNSEASTFFARALAFVNLLLLSGALLFEFSRVITSNIIYFS